MIEPKGRGAAWTEERGTSDEGRRRLEAPRRRAENTDVRRLATGVVYEDAWMRLRRDEVERRDGSRGTYAYVEKPDFALVIPAENDGFHLVEEYRYPIGRRTWSFPQGGWPSGRTGSPEELASQYLTDDLLSRAQVSGSPWLFLQSLFRWASLSFVGLSMLTFSVIGYFLAGSFALCALLKPIHAQTAGLWLLPDPEDTYSFSLRLGFSSPPAHGRELLGCWIVPLGLVFAMGLVLFTFHLGLWSIRKFWRPLRVA